MRSNVLLAALLLTCCENRSPTTVTPVHDEVASASVKAVSTVNSVPPPAPPPAPVASRPPLDAACARDADCAVTSVDLAAPSTCCPGCAWHPGTKASIAAFTRSCEASPPSLCPPIGCAMPLMVARCVASKCVAVVGP